MSLMTDETAKALREAESAESAAATRAEELKRACLQDIANMLPSRAEAIARRVAEQQPEVTKRLGKEGVAQLRADVRAASEVLGAEFVAAIDEIEWPPVTLASANVEARHIHSALFARFFRETGALTSAMMSHGYSFPGKGVREAILPQELYDERKFTPVAGALTDLNRARAAVAKARKVDDDATVGDLWGD